MIFPLLGFSINTLSLFGLVLAIGLVVDDAIVVVEAIEHHIEHGLSPKDAAFKAMEEVSAPVVGIAIVLQRCSFPLRLFPGITGRLYQQFAVTIAVSVIISAFNALTLSPALGALLLRPKKESRGPLGAFFRWFNRIFSLATNGYVSWCGALIHKMGITIIFCSDSLLWLAGSAPSSPPASCPMRTRAMCTSHYSFRMPLHCNARMPCERSGRNTQEHARCRPCDQRDGVQHAEQCSECVQFILLGYPEGVEGAQGARRTVFGHQSPHECRAEANRGRRFGRLSATCHPRCGASGGFNSSSKTGPDRVFNSLPRT